MDLSKASVGSLLRIKIMVLEWPGALIEKAQSSRQEVLETRRPAASKHPHISGQKELTQARLKMQRRHVIRLSPHKKGRVYFQYLRVL